MIKAITPSDKVNRALWRYAHGHTTWNPVGILIMEEVANGNLTQGTRSIALKDQALTLYHGK